MRVSHSQESRKANVPVPNKTGDPYIFRVAFPIRPRVNGAFIKNSHTSESASISSIKERLEENDREPCKVHKL